MKTKIIPALLDTADAPMLLINDQVHEWSNARFRDLPEALRTPILTWLRIRTVIGWNWTATAFNA
ncbi:hypothetical protein LH51_18420 [Nitrincola sp. A-D6]|uniref:hypothetical protein n=1 Tax=Nitrincola sp. A-D6 TaxID=1545442 RepID=UPI00051F9C43|nr:hypothetical protein [Nitrincola sp. A-D6]KGK40938.1 hypothetical protein LH51_18420 [Nitrincola sp. A-D6]